MKVKLAYTIEVDEAFRRAVRHHYDQTGIATREEIRRWFRDYGEEGGPDLRNEHSECCYAEPPEIESAQIIKCSHCYLAWKTKSEDCPACGTPFSRL